MKHLTMRRKLGPASRITIKLPWGHIPSIFILTACPPPLPGVSTKPFIRLRGRWLQRAGFQPGNYVIIEVIRPGELRITTQARES